MPSSRSRSWGEVNRASLAAYLVRARRWAAIAVRITANAPRPSPRYGSCGDPRIWLNIDVSFACAGRAPLAARLGGDRALGRPARVVERPHVWKVTRGLERGHVQGWLLVIGDSQRGYRRLGRLHRIEGPTTVIGRRQSARSGSTAVAGGIEMVVVIGDEAHLCVVGGRQQTAAAEWVERHAVVAGCEEAAVRADDQGPHVPGGRERARHEVDRNRAAEGWAQGRPGRARVDALIEGQDTA